MQTHPPACPTSQVMSLCDETLEERMRRGALGEPGAQLTACRELCEGLAYLHQLPEPIAHRDIKPANLLFRGSVLKIADMGQSRILEAGQTGMDTGTMGGTMGWMSPEEIQWDQVCQFPPSPSSRVVQTSAAVGNIHTIAA